MGVSNFSAAVKGDAGLDMDLTSVFDDFLRDYVASPHGNATSFGVLSILFAIMVQGANTLEVDRTSIEAVSLRAFLERILRESSFTNPHFLITRGLAFLNYFDDELFAEPSVDLGCSDGSTSKLLFRKRFRFGVDVLASFGESVQKNQMHDEYVVGSADAIPLPDGSVGSIVMNNTLYHAGDRNAIFREMFRVLRPGGSVAFDDITPFYAQDDARPFVDFIRSIGGGELAASFIKKRNEVYMSDRRINPHDTLTVESYPRVLEGCGFTQISARYFTSLDLNRLAYTIHDIEYMFRAYVNPRSEAYRTWVLGDLCDRLLSDRVACGHQKAGSYIFVTAKKP